MMRRILAVLTAAVLALGCTSTAFAAVYKSAKMDIGTYFSLSGVSTVVGDHPAVVREVTLSDVFGTNASQMSLDEAKDTMFNMLKKTAGTSANSNILAIFNVSYHDLDEDNGTEFVFYVDGVKKGDKIGMFHWNNKTLDWESGSNWVITKIIDKHIYAKVKKLSPVAFVKLGTSTNSATGTSLAAPIKHLSVNEGTAVNEIQKVSEPTAVEVNMSGTNTNVDVVKEAIANTNVSQLILSFQASIGINVQWTINRADFTLASDVASINMDVRRPFVAVSSSVVSTVANSNEKTQQIELAHDGSFKGFNRAILTMDAPSGVSVGMYANLFFYDDGVLRPQSSSVVRNIGGTLKYNAIFTHASQYVVVFGDNKLADKSAFDASKVLLSGVTTLVGDNAVKVRSLRASDIIKDAAEQGNVINLAKAKELMFDMLKKASGTSSNSNILAIFNAEYEDLDEDNGTELVFFIDSVKKGDKIGMFHWNNKTLDWESGSDWVITKITDKHVYAKVKKLSPVAFVKNASNATSGSGSTSSGSGKAATGSGKVAPKTGEA